LIRISWRATGRYFDRHQPRQMALAVRILGALCLLGALCVCAWSSVSVGLTPNLGRRAAMAFVADTFANKGFVREDPFGLSPKDAAALDARMNKALDDMQSKPASLIEADASTEPEAVLASLQERLTSLETATSNHEQELKERVQQNEMLREKDTVEPELLETDATRKGFISGMFNKAKGLATKVVGGAKKLGQAISGNNDKVAAQRYEDCMACRLIWKQVEMDVSNAKYIEDVQASFEHNCLDAQKSQIFYKACEDMYDDMYAMTDDYMSSDFTVDKMCQRANLCKL